MTVKVLFVCLGNICRSPTAHGVFQGLVDNAGLSSRIEVDSAGTGDWHIGRAPDKRMQASALRRGHDLSDLRARQVCAEDFAEFDLVLAMDKQNLADLQSLRREGGKAELKLFLDYTPAAKTREVPDPYYGGEEGFEDVLDLVENASAALLASIQATLAD